MGQHQRWTILVIAVLTGLVICAVPLMLTSTSNSNDAGTPPTATGGALAGTGAHRGGGAPVNGANPSEARDTGASNPETGRPACPAATDSQVHNSPLSSVILPCLGNTTATTKSRSFADTVAGKPIVINVWAYWCQPCRKELPIMDTVAQAHPEWNVVGVHVDKHGDAGASVLANVHAKHLPSFQDPDGTIARALRLPAVIPVTVVLKASGDVAKIYPHTFRSKDELEAAVTAALS